MLTILESARSCRPCLGSCTVARKVYRNAQSGRPERGTDLPRATVKRLDSSAAKGQDAPTTIWRRPCLYGEP